MKIIRIDLTNIFSYKNNVQFSFSNDKKMNVIIGENGFGKTSFINSIKIALHGVTNDVLKIGDTVLTKSDFIMGTTGFSGMINRVAKEEGVNECNISIIFEDKANKQHLLSRTYKVANTSYKEHLKVIDLSNDSVLEADEAQDFINANIINPSLAKFFLFDGEKVQDIANFTNEEFAKMLEDIFEEIGVFEQLIEDMRKLKREYQSETFTDTELKNKFKDLHDENDRTEKEIEQFIKDIKTNKSEKREFGKIDTELKNKINKLKSDSKDELKTFEEKLSELKHNKDKKLEVFKSQAVTCLPLLVDKEFKLKVEADIFANYYDLNYLPKEILDRKKIEFIELINEKIKNNEDISNIMEIFDKVFFSDNQDKRVSFVDTSKIKYQYETLDLQVLAFGTLLDNIIELDEFINKQEDNISEVKLKIKENEIELDSLLSKKEANSNQLFLRTSNIATFENKIIDNKQKLKDIEKSIHALSRQGHKEEILSAKINTCEKVMITSLKAIEVTKAKKREELETIVNEKFQLLIKENYVASSLKINDDFTINLFDEKEKAMDILSSSSGQKQIIATALIWAISDYVKNDMPMIVDTPLGRLDEKNQKLLLQNFYPNASSQIIMLPTPSELRAEGFKELVKDATIYNLSSNGTIATVKKGN